MRPETSVIIPVRNGEAFVNTAVASVLDQLGPHDEVFIIDDASHDRTLALLDLSDVRTRLLASNGSGPSVARNLGLSHARGKFIAFLDHDDLWPPGRHAVLKAALNADENANAAAGIMRIKMESSGVPGNYLRLDGHYVPTLPWTCLFRRQLIERAGFFAEDLTHGEDLDYYFRLIEAGLKIVYCNHDSLVYRRHAQNCSNSGPPQTAVLKTVLAKKIARNRSAAGR